MFKLENRIFLSVLLSAILYLSSVFCFKLFAGSLQKTPVDTLAMKTWTSVENSLSISHNGNWVGYSIKPSIPYKGYPYDPVFVLRDLSTSYSISFNNIIPETVQFSIDNRYCFFIRSRHLLIFDLEACRLQDSVSATSFQLSNVSGFIILVYYDHISSQLCIRKLSTGEQMVFYNIVEYSSFDRKLIFTEKIGNVFAIKRFDLFNLSEQRLWQGYTKPSHTIFSKNGSEMAFQANDIVFWHHNYGQCIQVSLPKDLLDQKLRFDSIKRFTKDGKLILRYLGPELQENRGDCSHVQIFNSSDADFYIDRVFHQLQYEMSFDPYTHTLVQLSKEGDAISSFSDDDQVAVVSPIRHAPNESYWNKKQQGKADVISLVNGQYLAKSLEGDRFWISSSGLYVASQKEAKGDIFIYNTANKVSVNLSHCLYFPRYSNLDNPLGILTSTPNLSFCNWLANEEKFILSDSYDIWVIDARRPEKSVCVTNGYGRRNGVMFEPVLNAANDSKFSGFIYLHAFNEKTKDAGFFRINWGIKRDPELISMGKYNYRTLYPGGSRVSTVLTNKRWLVLRETVDSSANLYITDNFVTFQPLTDNFPEQKFKWFTSELINYTTKRGAKCSAMLYKPTDLNVSKRYPVLFTFYEHQSDNLNKYIGPAYMDQFSFNIPMMIAQGYIVCVPDISFTLRETEVCIVDCIEAAADVIAEKGFVDSSRFAACGGSFGGYGVNCLAALSKKFKALISISGVSNMISLYGSVPGLGTYIMEKGQNRLGTTLARDPMVYLNNSPIASTTNVTTPILIVSTLFDSKVNVNQSYEWFISLRREGKQAWLLRYQQPGHGIIGELDSRDLYKRITQFFAYYLNGACIPAWMTDSLENSERSGDIGFKLCKIGIH